MLQAEEAVNHNNDRRHHNEDDHHHQGVVITVVMMWKWVHQDEVPEIRNNLCQGHHRQVNQGVVVAAARRDWKELLNLSRHATPRHKKQKWVWGTMG